MKVPFGTEGKTRPPDGHGGTRKGQQELGRNQFDIFGPDAALAHGVNLPTRARQYAWKCAYTYSNSASEEDIMEDGEEMDLRINEEGRINGVGRRGNSLTSL